MLGLCAVGTCWRWLEHTNAATHSPSSFEGKTLATDLSLVLTVQRERALESVNCVYPELPRQAGAWAAAWSSALQPHPPAPTGHLALWQSCEYSFTHPCRLRVAFVTAPWETFVRLIEVAQCWAPWQLCLETRKLPYPRFLHSRAAYASADFLCHSLFCFPFTVAPTYSAGLFQMLSAAVLRCKDLDMCHWWGGLWVILPQKPRARRKRCKWVSKTWSYWLVAEKPARQKEAGEQ